MPPPSLVKMDNGKESPQITIYPPKYTDLKSPEVLEPGIKHVKVYAGSTVVLRAKADRPLDPEQVWLEYRPENDKVMLPISMLTLLGQTNPLQAAAQAAGGQPGVGQDTGQIRSRRRDLQRHVPAVGQRPVCSVGTRPRSPRFQDGRHAGCHRRSGAGSEADHACRQLGSVAQRQSFLQVPGHRRGVRDQVGVYCIARGAGAEDFRRSDATWS